jgi:protein dithiol oxidoreductase (disulfide-forming)
LNLVAQTTSHRIMMKKLLSLFTAALALGVLAFTAQSPATAQQAPQVGRDFRILQKPQPTEGTEKIEVIEFFWYGCNHCYEFEPLLENWIKSAPKDVVVRRVPVAFRDDLVPHQRMFYTLEALGKVDSHHKRFFNALHLERKRILTAEELASWAAANDIDRDAFMKAYSSFSVQTKATRARQMAEAYQIDGVPMLAVNGRFVTGPSLTGSPPRSLQVVDFLINESRKKS